MKKLLILLKTIRLWYVFFAVTMVYLFWGWMKTSDMDTHASWGWGLAMLAMLVAHAWQCLYVHQNKAYWELLEANLTIKVEDDRTRKE